MIRTESDNARSPHARLLASRRFHECQYLLGIRAFLRINRCQELFDARVCNLCFEFSHSRLLVSFVRAHEFLFGGGACTPENLVPMRIPAKTVDDFLMVPRVPCILLVSYRFKQPQGFTLYL